MTVEVRHPEVVVQLSEQDGNAFSILGVVKKGLRRGGVEPDEISEFVKEATSGNYDHLLQTCFRWVTVD